MYNFLDGVISLVISDFKWELGVRLGVGSVAKETIGQGAAEALTRA